MKRILAVICAVALLFLSACSGKETAPLKKLPESVEKLNSSIVATNGDFALSWNNEKKCLTYENTATGDKWSTIPQQFLDSGAKFHRLLSAPLNLTCFNPKDRSVVKVSGYSYAVSSGRVGAEKIKNGIKVTYCFDKYGISIPVEYTLGDNTFDVKIVTSEIIETTFQVLEIEVTPNLCAVENATENSYIFIPSGSGATIDCANFLEVDKNYSGYIYGMDAARYITNEWYSEEKFTMPIFGMSYANSSLYGIIKSYDAAKINYSLNNTQSKYTSVYPSFELRGYDIITNTKNGTDFSKYAENLTTAEDIKISYFMLSGEKSNTTEAAKFYRDYLKTEYEMNETSESTNPLLTFYGGDLTTEYLLGVPKTKLSVLTSFKDVKEIVNSLSDKTGSNFDVQLKGYSKNGMTLSSVAGGFDYSGKFGSADDFKELAGFIKQKNSNFYFDFDIIRFSKSGNGFSTLYNAAKTANRQRMQISTKTIDVHSVDDNVAEYYLLSRGSIGEVTDKLIKETKSNGISGISLGSLGNIAYSDYEEEAYYNCGGIRKQVVGVIKKLQKNNHNVLVERANDYAAATANAVSNVAYTNGDYSVFSSKIPFYQIVFSGSKTLYSDPINAAANTRKAFLDAVATGVIPSFSIVKDYDVGLNVKNNHIVSKSLIKSNVDMIKEYVNEYKSVAKVVNGSKIDTYTTLENGVTKTVFENGTQIFVNYSDSALELDGIMVEGNSFKVVAK